MLKKQRREPQQPLFYRIYILYFEPSTSILKTINKQAYYRLSIWYQEQQIADMMEGLKPTILADKIFLPNANVNFNHAKSPEVSLHLWFHHNDEDHILAKADLDLAQFNQKYLQKHQTDFIQQNLTFALRNGELRLVFDIFVEKGKIQLDSRVRKFKQEQKKANKLKRIEEGRKKMSSVGEPLKRGLSIPSFIDSLFTQKRQSFDRSPVRTKIELKDSSINIDFEEDIEEEQKQEEERKVSPSPVCTMNQSKKLERNTFSNERPQSQPQQFKLIHIDSYSSGNYLEVDSAHQLKSKITHANTLKRILNQLEEKRVCSVDSQLSYQKESHGKQFSMLVGAASVVTDGSQASEMLGNNDKQTYSQRAVAKFKSRVRKCANTTLIILAIIALYFLFVPSAKFSKLPRSSRSKVKKIKDNWMKF